MEYLKIYSMFVVTDCFLKQELDSSISLQLYAPSVPRMDWNLVVVWVIATGTVMLGSLWSGTTKQKR